MCVHLCISIYIIESHQFSLLFHNLFSLNIFFILNIFLLVFSPFSLFSFAISDFPVFSTPSDTSFLSCEGSGFLTHHLALTNTFEASLRAIDPSVTLPYWDFTVEGEQVAILGEKPSYMKQITPVFSDTWFGSVDEYNHIVDSRWAHSKIPRQRDTSSGVRNSYGFLRSYWNNNPDPGKNYFFFLIFFFMLFLYSNPPSKITETR